MSPEAMMSEFPATVPSLVADFTALGVQSGSVLVLHASLKSLGKHVLGGPVAVILALEQVLGPQGTLVMPTHTTNLSDPATWHHPPVPEAWWAEMRALTPAFDVDLTPTYLMGVIAETFRKQSGVLRSHHPDASFAAWGKHARQITENHALTPLFGEHSPMARVYDLDGWLLLLLGVGHHNNTSLHFAESRARIPHGIMHTGSPIQVDGVQRWLPWDDIDWDDSGFDELGADFARDTGLQRQGKVAHADALLAPQRPLVDYAVGWLERHRG